MSEKTILLIDDDPEIVKTVQRYLQQEGYAVLVAYNGKDALAIAIGRDQAPDCIVLDVMLPDYNGWEITQRIRANPHTAVGRMWISAETVIIINRACNYARPQYGHSLMEVS
jgi:DNA-binding response OmpR family regulator